ncbi:MAG: DUF192 domain-containing protein [Symploca sp. SIO2E9]|nr:DUF192 domain-containing protein [Symploca sp. SIO2E9]
MNRLISLLGITLSICLMGCSASVQANFQDEIPVNYCQQQPSPPPVSPSNMNLGQVLPISAQTQINGQLICLEVAQTPQQKQLGLMYRTDLAPDRGMLFIFEPPRPVAFWMRNVNISLDMVFIRDEQVQAIAANVPPCTTPQCPTYGPPMAIDQVIELAGGRAAELGLVVGDQVSVSFLDAKTNQP